MLKDKALVRSKIVRAVTAKEASDDLASILPISAGELTVIRAYRFYKTLSAEPKKKTYIEVAKLLSAKEAIEVMTTIENRRERIIIRPEDLKKVDPTALPQDHPDHVCTDACYSFKVIEGSVSEVAEKLREMSDTPKRPISKFGDAAPATVFVPEWGPDTDTSNVAAGTPSPYLFPDKPLVPTKDAVFDGEYSAKSIEVLKGMVAARSESRVFVPCRWHGAKYIDQADGDRCTALDPGSEYFNDLYAPVRNVDLDEAAPVIHPAPTALDDGRYDDDGPQPEVYDDSGFRRDPAQAVERPSKAPLITLATIAAIVGLVLAYFHWFKH